MRIIFGEKMRTEEKIKVFISSKCGGPRVNFDEIVKSESSDKKQLQIKLLELIMISFEEP